MEGTNQDHWVQLLTLHRTAPKNHTMCLTVAIFQHIFYFSLRNSIPFALLEGLFDGFYFVAFIFLLVSLSLWAFSRALDIDHYILFYIMPESYVQAVKVAISQIFCLFYIIKLLKKLPEYRWSLNSWLTAVKQVWHKTDSSPTHLKLCIPLNRAQKNSSPHILMLGYEWDLKIIHQEYLVNWQLW